MNKRVVLYSSNSKRRSKDSNCVVFPKWNALWDKLAEEYPACDIYLVVQLNGRYYLDIYDGELISPPDRIHLEILDMEAGLEEFVERITELKPDVAIAMPGPVSGMDWNGLRDASIAEELKCRGIETICYPLRTAEICFDKWLTHQFLEEHGFNVAKAVYVHHELFFAGKNDPYSTGNVYQEMVLQKVKRLPFPVIIKGTTGSASSGIVVSASFEDAKTYLLSENNKEDLIVEEMLKGQEYGTEIHGCRGHYNVIPPIMKFTTDNEDVIDPLGLTTLKFGPMTGEKYHSDEFVSELTRMAELLDLAGNNNLDMMLCDGKWYILEINARWSGVTTLTACCEDRSPYAVYLEQYTGSKKDYTDLSNLRIACNFKMSGGTEQMLEKLSKEDCVDSVIRYEIIRPDGTKYNFNDVIIGGFDSFGEMLKSLARLQKAYPDEISKDLVSAITQKLPML
jgi:D-alanine-D-alanine ligase-like ATP-grasp enzyme